MARPRKPDGRRIPVSFKLTEEEAALVDSLRGDVKPGPWLRDTALEAARRFRDSRIRERLGVRVIVSDGQPPGTLTALSVTGRDADGNPVVSAASAVNIAPGEAGTVPKSCRHKGLRLSKGVCPDCLEYVTSKH